MFSNQNSGQIANIESHLTRDRLTQYLSETANDCARAIQLYCWNTAVGSAFYGPLQALEVGFRNGLHRELSVAYGTLWYDDATLTGLDPSGRIAAQVAEAKVKLTQTRRPLDPPHMVAQLSFGFWITLLGRRFEHSLWLRALRLAFPNHLRETGQNPNRAVVSKRLHHLLVFRNRIAHHEPTFKRALSADYASILSVCTWMYDDLVAWIELNSQVKSVLAQRP
jgi:hypothetical protein